MLVLKQLLACERNQELQQLLSHFLLLVRVTLPVLAPAPGSDEQPVALQANEKSSSSLYFSNVNRLLFDFFAELLLKLLLKQE